MTGLLPVPAASVAPPTAAAPPAPPAPPERPDAPNPKPTSLESGRATLRSKKRRFVQIRFANNPTSIKVSTTAKTEAKNTVVKEDDVSEVKSEGTRVVLSQEAVLWGEVGIVVDGMYLIGTRTRASVERLMSLAYTNSADGALEPLVFEWGPLSYPVKLKSITVTYERFLSDGTPIRAACSLTLQLNREDLPATNPSSRAEPGSSSHSIVQGDSLPTLATATYGHPRHWRAIAEANDIDDPLRVRPGRDLYLPPPSSVTSPRALP
ncbi:MAG: hypothetical protein M3N95_09905 [Actinomycetota bacterium]|nr:hypothetical protein [Actinomycetota bacterium]